MASRKLRAARRQAGDGGAGAGGQRRVDNKLAGENERFNHDLPMVTDDSGDAERERERGKSGKDWLTTRYSVCCAVLRREALLVCCCCCVACRDAIRCEVM